MFLLPIPSRRKKNLNEPDFEHPPLWIHASAAAKCFTAPDKIPAMLTRQVKRTLREPARSK